MPRAIMTKSEGLMYIGDRIELARWVKVEDDWVALTEIGVLLNVNDTEWQLSMSGDAILVLPRDVWKVVIR